MYVRGGVTRGGVWVPPCLVDAPCVASMLIFAVCCLCSAGVLTIVGGALAHLTLGSLYCWYVSQAAA